MSQDDDSTKPNAPKVFIGTWQELASEIRNLAYRMKQASHNLYDIAEALGSVAKAPEIRASIGTHLRALGNDVTETADTIHPEGRR